MPAVVSNFEVATVGDNCIDRYLPPVGLSTVGGNAVNVAVHLQRLRLSVGYFGRIGSDSDGTRIRSCLTENGVSTEHLQSIAGQTAYTEIGSGPAGERTILSEEFGVCRGYRPGESETLTLSSTRHVHIGWLDDGGALTRILTEAGVAVSQDLSVNADQKDIEAAGLAIAFAATNSSKSARLLLEHMIEAGAHIAVVTCGAEGSVASDGIASVATGSIATSVVDTLGAGDTFIAGFIAAHLEGRSLQSCLETGAEAASLTCAHYGGFPQRPQPWRRT